MTDITIPPEAVEAAARAMWRTDDPSQWELGMSTAALRAGIAAWPGVWHIKAVDFEGKVILPLPQEPA